MKKQNIYTGQQQTRPHCYAILEYRHALCHAPCHAHHLSHFLIQKNPDMNHLIICYQGVFWH